MFLVEATTHSNSWSNEERRQGESGLGMNCVLERAACLHCLLAYYCRELWSKCWVPQRWYICISSNNIRYIWCPSLWNFTQRLQKPWARFFFYSEKLLHSSLTILISVEEFPNCSRSKRRRLGLSALFKYSCLMDCGDTSGSFNWIISGTRISLARTARSTQHGTGQFTFARS